MGYPEPRFCPENCKWMPINEERQEQKKYEHHWENWAEKEGGILSSLPVVHNVCDWMAMGTKFNDTAKEYYEKNKEKMKIPKWAESVMYEIFECVYG